MPRTIKLLLIEDNRLDARRIRQMLDEGGESFVLETAGELREGLATLRRRGADVVLLDLSLPDAGPSESFERVQEEAPDIPVVIVTAMDDESRALDVVEQGAQDYLVKGNFDAPTLVRSIRYAQERHRLSLALQARARQQAAVARLGQRAILDSDLGTLMDATVALVADTLMVEYCKILELREDDRLRLRSGIGWKPGLVGNCELPNDLTNQAGFTLRERLPVIVDDLETESRFGAAELLVDHGVVSGVSVAIPCGDGPYGVLGAHSRHRRRFTEDDAHFLTAVANVVGSAILSSRSAEALRLNEAKFRALIENGTDLITVLDTEGRILYASPSIGRQLGHSCQELGGQPILDYIDDSDQPRFKDALERVIRDPGAHPLEVFRFRSRSGEWRLLESVGSNLLGNPVVSGVVINSRDVTEREQGRDRQRRLQDQLRQAQKMEAVGRLAGGIAHDFNNILTSVQLCAESLRSALADRPALHAKAQEIESSAQRAASLTRQLLAFSRLQVLQPRVLELRSVVAETEIMLRRVIGEDITLKTVIAPDTGRVHADPGQIHQVLLNLAINARDAMPEGGELTLVTRSVQLDQESTTLGDILTPGPYVELLVRDTGIGMDEETQKRIFEPFFTTKDPGKGTGLGLSTVYGIVKQSDGYILNESRVGQGTTFRIFLPRVEAPLESEEEAPACEPVANGSGRVLVAEDEDELRYLLSETLSAKGYHVFEASCGTEALEVAEREPVDLLITDVVMPDMRGTELERRIRERHEQLPVLYMSGYPGEGLGKAGQFGKERPFLQKPFSSEQLLTKVQEIIEAASPSRQPSTTGAQVG